MLYNADKGIAAALKHEGGWADHPRDPGGATNRGVTIGTLRSLGMDLDGDGDVDIADLRKLTEQDAIKVYKKFYWDKVEGDLLPSGVDYATADFAINSGPKRAAEFLQRAVNSLRSDANLSVDGDIGPASISEIAKCDPVELITMLCQRRLAFMKRLKIWPTFKNGWTTRVNDVQELAISMANDPRQLELPLSVPAKPFNIWKAILSIFFKPKE
jgi:lysozyme family protein